MGLMICACTMERWKGYRRYAGLSPEHQRFTVVDDLPLTCMHAFGRLLFVACMHVCAWLLFLFLRV
jgi:hypothetical protein